MAEHASQTAIQPTRVAVATPIHPFNSLQARICIDKIEYGIGDFDTEDAAAKAYDLEAIRRGKLRALNFIYRGEGGCCGVHG